MFKLPMKNHEGKTRKKRYRTTACGLHARMAIQYDPSEEIDFSTDTEVTVNAATGRKEERTVHVAHPGEPERNLALAPVCAVDDAMGLWPRYANLMSDKSYQPE